MSKVRTATVISDPCSVTVHFNISLFLKINKVTANVLKILDRIRLTADASMSERKVDLLFQMLPLLLNDDEQNEYDRLTHTNSHNLRSSGRFNERIAF
jgi:hypothetical protein